MKSAISRMTDRIPALQTAPPPDAFACLLKRQKLQRLCCKWPKGLPRRRFAPLRLIIPADSNRAFRLTDTLSAAASVPAFPLIPTPLLVADIPPGRQKR